MSLNIAVIYGSVRSSRQGIKLAKYIVKKCEERGCNTTLIDPLEHDIPFLDKMYKEYPEGEAPGTLEKIAGVLNEADGFIIVSAEYNHNIPPALSNLMDHFMPEYFFKPSAIVSYSAGIFAGVRAAIILRSFIAELGTPSIPSVFAVGKVRTALDNNGNFIEDADKYEKKAKKFFNEFEWYANAFKEARAKGKPY